MGGPGTSVPHRPPNIAVGQELITLVAAAAAAQPPMGPGRSRLNAGGLERDGAEVG